MSILTPIKGLFYVVGSKDLPLGYNHNDRFGFEGESTEPVFKYSITNCKNLFLKPVTCMRLQNNEIQNLLIESNPATGLEGINDTDFAAHGFESLFQALYILYDRSDVTDPDIVYGSKGDRLLSEASLYNRYVAGSLYMELAIVSTELRISYVKFKFKLFNNTEPTDIKVYFIPDTMFDVMAFEDDRYHISYTTKNKPVTEEGLLDVLVEGEDSLLSMESLRNYGNVCSFKTTFNVVVYDIVVDTYIRTFFIHNIMYKGYELTTYKKILLIKKFLNYKYQQYGDSRRLILHNEYPELFTENDIDIFPIVAPITDGRRPTPTSNILIQNEIERRGITIDLTDPDNARRVELITLEGIGPFDNNDLSTLSMANRNFINPIMVISNDLTSSLGPISGSFASFAPQFTGYVSNGQPWEQFFFFLKLFIKIATGTLPWKYTNLDDNQVSAALHIPISMQLTTDRVIFYGVEFLNSISFNFLGSTYTVHGFYKYGALNEQ